MDKRKQDFRRLKNQARAFLESTGLGSLEDYTIPHEQGLMSIVLFPKAKPGEVLKIPRTDRSIAAFLEEAATLESTKGLDIKSMDIVRALEIGRDPNYIRMNRLGPTLAALWTKNGVPGDEEVRAVGRAIGEFVVEFHQKTGGLIHHDIHFQNLTRQSDRRYGTLDFGNVSSGDYEAAFLKLAVQRPNILMAASERIHELTGKGLDPARLREKTLQFWQGVDASQLTLAKENLQEFEVWGKGERPVRSRLHKRKLVLGLER